MRTFKYKFSGGEKKWTYDNDNDTGYSEYTLEITPKWTSQLDGNPAAILVEATHITEPDIKDSEKYTYKQLWANYDDESGNQKFEGIDLNQDITIKMFPLEESGDSDKIKNINTFVKSTDVIKIDISRVYDGVIEFKLTPVMSYGTLDHLAKTITLDQSKIASGEIILSKWSYIVNKSIAEVIKDNTVSENIVENVKTTTTLQKQDDNTTIEIKQIDTTQTKDVKDPIVSTTYIHTMSLTYGFDSYKFENQNVTDIRSIKFFDLQEIDFLDLPKDSENCYESTLQTILKEYIPVHVETIPTGLLSGGNTTINYILDSTECKLKPDHVYLCICELITQIQNEAKFIHYDYRYLYTNSIFNEYFGIEEDYNNLNLNITPSLELEFKSDKISESLITKNKNEIQWLSEEKKTTTPTLKYDCTVDPSLNAVQVVYTDNLFTLNYTGNSLDVQRASVIYLPNNTTNGVLNCTYEKSTDDNIKVTCIYDFTLKITEKLDSLEVDAVKTNLLNLTNPADQYKVFLSEANGLANTMMMEDDQIFAVGMHNDGGGSEEWYGEVGTISEGFTSSATQYDDSVATNMPNEIDLYYYDPDVKVGGNNGANLQYNYYLKHGSELIQYPSEKDDGPETLATYLESDNPHQFLVDSLESRGIVPILFVTSGPDDHKGQSCIGLSFSRYTAAVSPTIMYNSNAVEEESKNNNFNAEYPYWFLSWSGVNARQSTEIIGTFMVKYVNSKGVSTYIPTNNYFSVSCKDNKLYTAYLEDCKDKVTNITYSTSIPQGYRSEPNKWSNGTYTAPDPSKLTIPPNSAISKSMYTIGDLLSIQLAQFAAIDYYDTPRVVSGDFYTISDSDKASLKLFANQTIDIISNYTYEINDTLSADLNKNLYANGVNLNIVNEYLPSNNLKFTSSENKFYMSDKVSFTPLKSLLPDFSKNSYLVTITPDGESRYDSFSFQDTTNDLYYWDGKEYKVYEGNDTVELFKYGGFKKCVQNLDDSLNSSNYDTTDNELLDNFIKVEFNPNYTHTTTMPLKHSRYKGIYTTNQRGRTAKLKFTRFESPSTISESGIKNITNVAIPPTLLFKKGEDSVQCQQWLIDPKLRL